MSRASGNTQGEAPLNFWKYQVLLLGGTQCDITE